MHEPRHSHIFDDSEALLDRSGAARFLGISVSGVDRLVRAGLPFLQVAGVKRFQRSTVLAWLRSHTSERAGASGSVTS